MPSMGLYFAMMSPGTRGTPVGQVIYFVGKILLLAVPLIAFRLQKRNLDILWPITKRAIQRGLIWGICFAFAISIGILIALGLGLDPTSIKAAAFENGLNSWPRYLGLAIYLSFFNSLCEEFISRDFIFNQWQAFFTPITAAILANMSFTLHHTLALLNQTTLLPTILGSLAVFLAGCTWSWLYARYRSLLPAYFSHILADLAIFAWGAWIIFGR